MKTVFIDCSPKKKGSASGFIMGFTALFVRGRKKKEKLRSAADHERILSEISEADTVVLSMPLYVDGVPSHLLPFLKKMELHCYNRNKDINVYVIANNGFIEGKQNEPLMQIVENFCYRSRIKWRGGLGIGGGVMMNVVRILLLLFLGIALLRSFLLVISDGTFFQVWPWIIYGKQILGVLALGCCIIVYDIWLAICINRKKNYGKHYTRIMLPSFVFIICANIFFTIISVIQGGIFRGWLSKKEPTI